MYRNQVFNSLIRKRKKKPFLEQISFHLHLKYASEVNTHTCHKHSMLEFFSSLCRRGFIAQWGNGQPRDAFPTQQGYDALLICNLEIFNLEQENISARMSSRCRPEYDQHRFPFPFPGLKRRELCHSNKKNVVVKRASFQQRKSRNVDIFFIVLNS